ncbi:MAG: DUF2784 domain-containing protein [Rhodocyclales bacterium]|nr:DUF2784 domain-containing protein [Rhodocyclales bacterium]
MSERVAADLIVLLHLAFILFVGLGALLSLRWKAAAWLHLPALAWGVTIEFTHGICPLTPLEQRLRLAAGDAGYSGSFIQHYLLPLIYPAGLDARSQYAIGVAAIVVNLAVYAWVLLRRPRRGPGKPQGRRL